MARKGRKITPRELSQALDAAGSWSICTGHCVDVLAELRKRGFVIRKEDA